MRPPGVTVIALVMIFSGLFLLISGISMITMKDLTFPVFVEEYRLVLNQTINSSSFLTNQSMLENQTLFPVTKGDVELLYMLIAYVAIAAGSIYAVTGAGLWLLKEWARIVAVMLSGIAMIYSFLAVFFDPVLIVQLVLNLLVIWYLMKRDVREAFRGEHLSIEERILGKDWNEKY